MDNMGGLFGFIGLACGIYVFYALYQMKTTGEINTTILLPKTANPKKCKDKDAYIKAVSPRMIVLGVSAILYGTVDLVGISGAVLWAVLILFMAVLIWFGVTTSKLNKTYF